MEKPLKVARALAHKLIHAVYLCAETIVGLAERLRAREGGFKSPGVVGRIRLDRWLNEQGNLNAGLRVPIGKLAEEYFGNGRGGFGQYYAGPEAELGVVGEEDGQVRLFDPKGTQLAEIFERIPGTVYRLALRHPTGTSVLQI